MPTRETRPQYSVVVPVFENATSIQRLVDRLAAVFELQMGESYEVILVDDGSHGSATHESLLAVARQNPHVSVIRLMRNFGKPTAVMCGLAHATGNWIVTIDDDLQQRPEDIVELARHREHDVVVAVFAEKQHGMLVNLTGSLKAWFDRRILKLPIRMGPLKLIKGQVAADMLRIQTVRPYLPALMAHVTSDFEPVPLEHQVSELKRSRYTLGRRLRQFSDLIIGNSSFVLRFVGFIGALSLSGGVIGSIALAIGWSMDRVDSPEWLLVLCVVLGLGGIGLIGLGAVGEYLLRILELSSGKPLYLIRSVEASRHSKKTRRRSKAKADADA